MLTKGEKMSLFSSVMLLIGSIILWQVGNLLEALGDRMQEQEDVRRNGEGKRRYQETQQRGG